MGYRCCGPRGKLEIGSYSAAWAMLAKIRSTLMRLGRDLLTGAVEVAESPYGGYAPGVRGRGEAANSSRSSSPPRPLSREGVGVAG